MPAQAAGLDLLRLLVLAVRIDDVAVGVALARLRRRHRLLVDHHTNMLRSRACQLRKLGSLGAGGQAVHIF